MNKVLVLGSTGMLGQAIVNRAKELNFTVKGVARKNTDYSLDVKNDKNLENVIKRYGPNIVINAIAIVNLSMCEENPGLAYIINSRLASVLSCFSRKYNFKFVHISTDHYYSNAGRKKHKESLPLKIMNEYARTKYIAEVFARNNPSSLILRTNIVGHRWGYGPLTFSEWAIYAIRNHKPLVLFDDIYTSPIHVNSFSKEMFNLIKEGVTGTLNLASSEVSSKKEFIEGLAKKIDVNLDWTTTGSGKNREPIHANSMGLDVSKAEKILNYKLPTLDETLSCLVQENIFR